MRIPADAIIDQRKLRDYLLVRLDHDDKSGYLAKAGFEQSNPQALDAAIRRLCAGVDAVRGEVNQHGSKWLVSGIITGSNGRTLGVRLVWMQQADDGKFYFVTLVPETGGRV